MKPMRQWLCVNLFFLAMYLAGISLSFLFGLLLDRSGWDGPPMAYAASALAVLALVLAYHLGKRLHARLSRR